MKFIEQLGNIKIYTQHNAENDITVTLINGNSIVASEVYFTDDERKAIDDLLAKTLDIHTEEFVYGVFLERHSPNTFEIPHFEEPSDWFCRIDDTKYFKHYYKHADDFIKDKEGKRIIDR